MPPQTPALSPGAPSSTSSCLTCAAASLGECGPALQAASADTAGARGRRAARTRAYVTLFSQDAYLPGVLALQRSARLVGLRHPLIVMHTCGVSAPALQALQDEGCQLRSVETFTPPGVDASRYVRKLYAECWNKLHMWDWEDEFDRLVYLDADMAVLQNIDHLFDLPPAPLYAVGDCYGGRETAAERDACAFFHPHKTPAYFNAGFLVMAPDRAELRRMHDALESGTIEVGRFSEQDFLNGYFAGRWRHLPYAYNAQKRIKFHHRDMWNLADVAVLHYVDDKPWSHRDSEENKAYAELCNVWWDVFEGRPPALPAPAMATGAASPASLAAPAEALKAPPSPALGGPGSCKIRTPQQATIRVQAGF